MIVCVAMCTCVHMEEVLGAHLTWNSHSCNKMSGGPLLPQFPTFLVSSTMS